MESAHRMIRIQVEMDSRRLGGSALLIPFANNMLASTICRQILQGVLTDHLPQPDLLAITEKIIKQHDDVSCFGRKTRVDKDLANATACLDLNVMSSIETFLNRYFTFKVTS